MASITPKDRLARYLDHLDGIFQLEPRFYPLESRISGATQVVCIVYEDIPESGSITGFTYGLSEVAHEKWVHGRPELTITVDSSDLAWPLAVGEIANNLRGECPFCYGDVINFGAQISEGSEMSAFFIFVPSILEKSAFLGIDVGAALPVNIAGVYPIYDSERDVIASHGLEKFWHHPDFDLYNIGRPRVHFS